MADQRGKKWYIFCGYLMLLGIGFLAGGRQIVLEDITDTFQMGNTGIGIFTACWPMAVMVTALLCGGLADIISKKKIIGIFGAILTAGTIIGSFAGSAIAVMAAFFMIGIGVAIVNGTMASALLETDPSGSIRFSTMTQVFYASGAVLGPMILSGFLEKGASWRLYFIIGAILYFIATLLFVTSPYKTIVPAKRPKKKKGEKRKKGGILCLVLICFIISGGMYATMENCYLDFIKSYYVNELSNEALAGIVISVGWISMVPARLAITRLKKKKGLVAGGCCIVAALMALVLVFTRNAVVALICTSIFGLSCGPVYPIVLSMMMDAFPSHTGLVSNLVLFGCGVFNSLGSLLSGMVNDAVGLGNGYALVAVYCIITGLFAYLGWRRGVQEEKLSE